MGLLALALLVSLAGACTNIDNEFFAGDDGGTGNETGTVTCTNGNKACMGTALQRCVNNKWQHVKTCNHPRVCSSTLGDCADCEPSNKTCKGDDVHKCTAQGKVGAKVQSCPVGSCQNGRCVDLCAQARNSKSYIGCDYWPTVTANASLVLDFEYAVAVANASAGAATVKVSTKANKNLKTVTVPAKSVTTIKLPWVSSLKMTATSMKSVKAPGAAYKLTSTRPVTVYQFNALDYVLKGDCKKGTDSSGVDGKCYSYSNDASLLLPEHALGKEYMVLSRPTMIIKRLGQLLKSPGFFAIVATKPGTTKVNLQLKGNTASGNGIPAHKKGATPVFALQQWEVLQILSELPGNCTTVKSDSNGFSYCDLKGTADLTGSFIKADKDVAVYSGHNCTFVPFDKWACDHLEEAIFPTHAMGKKYIGSHTKSSGNDPALYRVVSAAGENIISFEPAVHGTKKLGKGEWFEFTTKQNFEVSGTDRFQLVKFMVGQNYSNLQPGKGAPNDPAMALAVPVEQYRTSYYFLAPATYAKNYVNIHAPDNATVKLNGTPIPSSRFVKVNNKSAWSVAKVEIAGGSHYIESTSKTGITVYGVGSYTSYMYPGGLDLKSLL